MTDQLLMILFGEALPDDDSIPGSVWLGDWCPRFSKCRARPYIASGKLVTHTKTQLEAIRQASAAKRGLALKALPPRRTHEPLEES